MNVWILTYEVNEYDQQGEYFIEVFANKPNREQLEALGLDSEEALHLLNVGGRRGEEYRWYHLREEKAK